MSKTVLTELWKDVEPIHVVPMGPLSWPEAAFVNYDGAHLFEDAALGDSEFWFEKIEEADDPLILEETHP